MITMRERFHYPSFKWYVSQRLRPLCLSFYIRNWSLFVLSYDEDFTQGDLQDIIIECIILSIDAPQGAPDGSRRGALIDAPLAAHCGALEDTLLVRKDYLVKRDIRSADGIQGEEFIVNLRKLNQIVVETRERKDFDLVTTLIEGDKTISYRGLQDKLRYRLGVYFSDRRIKRIMKNLDKRGKTAPNGNLMTYGRDVIS